MKHNDRNIILWRTIAHGYIPVKINASELCEYHNAVLWVLVYNAKQSDGQFTSRICTKPCVFLVHIETCLWKLSHAFIKFKKDFCHYMRVKYKK